MLNESVFNTHLICYGISGLQSGTSNYKRIIWILFSSFGTYDFVILSLRVAPPLFVKMVWQLYPFTNAILGYFTFSINQRDYIIYIITSLVSTHIAKWNDIWFLNQVKLLSKYVEYHSFLTILAYTYITDPNLLSTKPLVPLFS